VATQPCAFETSYCNGGGAAFIAAPNFAQGCQAAQFLFYLSVGTSEIGKCQVRLSSSCRIPNQTSGKMLIPLLLTVLQISLPFARAEQPGQNATAHTTVGWVSDGDNKRSTISLLYNCLFTIFLCTWSAMHLNVPGEMESRLQTFRRKCKWMLVGVLAPECVAMLAIMEWYEARKLVTHVCINPTFARDDR
jgi:hypothetical protein